MQALNKVETDQISGGRQMTTASDGFHAAPNVIVAPGGGSGGGGDDGIPFPWIGGGGGGIYTPEIVNLITSSPTLLNDFANGFDATYHDYSGARAGTSVLDPDGHTADIATQNIGHPLQTVSLISHEAGHFIYNNIDTNAADYSNETSYTSAQNTNEGYAQIHAIKVHAELFNAGFNESIPGSLQHAAAQKDIYAEETFTGQTTATIAHDIGVNVGTDKVGESDTTYNQQWHHRFVAAHPGRPGKPGDGSYLNPYAVTSTPGDLTSSEA